MNHHGTHSAAAVSRVHTVRLRQSLSDCLIQIIQLTLMMIYHSRLYRRKAKIYVKNRYIKMIIEDCARGLQVVQYHIKYHTTV